MGIMSVGLLMFWLIPYMGMEGLLRIDDVSPIYPMRNKWLSECLEAYQQIIPKFEPVEDWERRIQLYALYVHFALPFPYYLYSIS